MIRKNLEHIQENIKRSAAAAKRTPEDVRLVCVTKGRQAEDIKEALSAGISDIGENKVQEAAEKYPLLKGGGVKFHFIGHLQTNKASDAVDMFDLIHSVDSMRLAMEIDRQAARIGKVQNILIEVNCSGEETKFGVGTGDAITLAKALVDLKNIRLLGLMTMAPLTDKKEDSRPYFRKLRELGDELIIHSCVARVELSMGMSQDYEIAIEEGATMVRIGTAIFEGQR